MKEVFNSDAAVGPRDPAEPSGVMLWWPVVVALIFIGALSVSSIVIRLIAPFPHDPWEPIIAAEGYRASVGLPVYTKPEQDHSTHIYGPLITYLLGMIFKWTGVGFLPARLLSVVSILFIITVVTLIYFRKLPLIFICAGIVMLLSVNLRTNGYFAQSRPDLIALAVAMTALIFLYRGYQGERWRSYALGIVLLCGAYLFKQSMAMFAAVPMVCVLLHREARSWRKWLLAAAPLSAIMLLILAIRFMAPMVHFYMIEVVARYPLRDTLLVSSAVRFIGSLELIPMALAILFVVPAVWSHRDPRLSWLASACIVAVPASLLAHSKEGGVENSYLPALLPVVAFCIVIIASGWKAMTGTSQLQPWKMHGFAWLFACVLVASAAGDFNDHLRAAFSGGVGDRHYPKVVERVRTLRGRVVCPDDPTIPIIALGQVSRSVWGEHDTQFIDTLPGYFASEIQNADWVILMDSNQPMYELPEHLRAWGFTSVGWGGDEMGSYTLWQRPGRKKS